MRKSFFGARKENKRMKKIRFWVQQNCALIRDNGWVHGWVDGVDGCMVGLMVDWMDERKNGWVHGWVDGRLDWMDERKGEWVYAPWLGLGEGGRLGK